ncbi:MAG: hypothetical protein ACLQNE_31020 [Thermoguttaceae bacterium]|jgi:hypothetical protein
MAFTHEASEEDFGHLYNDGVMQLNMVFEFGLHTRRGSSIQQILPADHPHDRRLPLLSAVDDSAGACDCRHVQESQRPGGMPSCRLHRRGFYAMASGDRQHSAIKSNKRQAPWSQPAGRKLGSKLQETMGRKGQRKASTTAGNNSVIAVRESTCSERKSLR